MAENKTIEFVTSPTYSDSLVDIIEREIRKEFPDCIGYKTVMVSIKLVEER